MAYSYTYVALSKKDTLTERRSEREAFQLLNSYTPLRLSGDRKPGGGAYFSRVSSEVFGLYASDALGARIWRRGLAAAGRGRRKERKGEERRLEDLMRLRLGGSYQTS